MRSILRTIEFLPTIDIRVCLDASEARAAMAAGHCPVECSFGSDSVVDGLVMDHHGEYSLLDPVCSRALTMWADVRTGYPCPTVHPAKFAVTGVPDADASLAIFFLSSLHEYTPEGVMDICEAVAEYVARADRGIFDRLQECGLGGQLILAWRQRQVANGRPEASSYAWISAVRDWAEIITAAAASQLLTEELSNGCCREAERQWEARAAQWEFPCFSDIHAGSPGDFEVSPTPPGLSTGDYGLVVSSAAGADVWYGEMPSLSGYVAYIAGQERIAISLRPGTGGEHNLLELASILGPGWGGREEILGSPRGAKMALSDARAVLNALIDLRSMRAQPAELTPASEAAPKGVVSALLGGR
jgi:hypothetical protein